jgi:hypothetical protein
MSAEYHELGYANNKQVRYKGTWQLRDYWRYASVGTDSVSQVRDMDKAIADAVLAVDDDEKDMVARRAARACVHNVSRSSRCQTLPDSAARIQLACKPSAVALHGVGYPGLGIYQIRVSS